MLDPIADKLLVGTTLLMLTYDNTIDRAHVAAAVIILCREILVSGLREFLAELNVQGARDAARQVEDDHADDRARRAAGRARPATSSCPASRWTGLVMLWMAALLTLWTGYDYLKAAIRTAMEH